jgi:hypothetical protein
MERGAFASRARRALVFHRHPFQTRDAQEALAHFPDLTLLEFEQL